MSEVKEITPEEQAKKDAAAERMRKVRAARSAAPAAIDKDSLVKEVMAGVLGALKEAGVFKVDPATRPAMARTNPGIAPPIAAAVGYKCKCGLIHTPEMHYGVDIQPGMHYCNVEDFPDAAGIPSDIQRMKSQGFEIAKQTSDRHCVMFAPEGLAMKSRDEAAMLSRSRIKKKTISEAEAAARVQRGEPEAAFDDIRSGTPIHIDLSRGAVGETDDFAQTGDNSPDY